MTQRGDEVWITKDGPQIPGKALEPIGIRDGSACWGIAVPDVRAAKTCHPNVLISPIHPDSWPFVFRLWLKLSDQNGTLDAAARILSDEGVNVLFAECAPSGYHHATWNIIGEALPVRKQLGARKKMSLDPQRFISHDDTEVSAFCRDLAQGMLSFVHDIETRLMEEYNAHPAVRRADGVVKREAGTHDPPLFAASLTTKAWEKVQEALKPMDEELEEYVPPFLHYRIARNIGLLYDPEELQADARKVSPRHLIRAVVGRWLENLAFFSVFGDYTRVMEFRYDESREILTCESNQEAYEELVSSLPVETLAVASFSELEYCVRLKLLGQSLVDQRLNLIRVKYKANFADLNPKGSGRGENSQVLARHEDSSKGLLHALCSECCRSEISLLRVANSIKKLTEREEEGEVVFVGAFPEGTDAAQERQRLQSKIESVSVPSGGVTKNVEATDAVVSAYPFRRVYLSLILEGPQDKGHPKEPIIRQLVTEAARAHGWRVETTRVAGPIAGQVFADLSRCERMLQVAYVPGRVVAPIGNATPESSLSCRYLNYEFGLANASQMPVARMVEITNGWDQTTWQSRLVPGGDELFGFHLHAPNAKDRFREIFEILLSTQSSSFAHG